MNRLQTKRQRQSGFSLVELAIVLAIIGILMGGAMMGISIQREHAKYESSSQRLAQTKEALMSFSLINRYLPCPDINGDGHENRNGNQCARVYGRVPYLILGLTKADVSDSWGNPLVYQINQKATVACSQSEASYFCNSAPPRFTLMTPPVQNSPLAHHLRVCNQSAGQCNGATLSSAIEADRQTVVLIAYNENGRITWTQCGKAAPYERENCDGDAFFSRRPINTQADRFFDDQLETISAYEIKSLFLKNNPDAIQ